MWLSGGVGGMGRTPDELLGMGKVAGRRVRAVPCGVSTDCTLPLTEEHLGRFQTHVTVRMKQSSPSSYSINFVEYVSSTGVQSSALFLPCSVHPPSQPAICSSIHHSLINPSIHS